MFASAGPPAGRSDRARRPPPLAQRRRARRRDHAPEIARLDRAEMPTATATAGWQTDVPHADLANAIRALAMDAVEQAKSGHPGMPMGMADVATVLFTRFLKFDPAHPEWPHRDRFVLSAGHGSMLLYALLHLTGYADMTMAEL